MRLTTLPRRRLTVIQRRLDVAFGCSPTSDGRCKTFHIQP